MKCEECKYAVWDFEEYCGTTEKEWFIEECKKGRDIMSDSDCPDYDDWEEDDT